MQTLQQADPIPMEKPEGELVPPLLVKLMRLSLALTTLLLVLAAPSARALSVRALLLLRLLGPRCTAMPCVLATSPDPRTLFGHGFASVMSLALLIAETCRHSRPYETRCSKVKAKRRLQLLKQIQAA